MHLTRSKKMLPMNILDILKTYSDKDHSLNQKQIGVFLEQNYDIFVDRKTIKRTLMNLIDFGYEIGYTRKTRKNKYGKDEVVYSDWYLAREFEPAEIQLLIDSLLFSKYNAGNQHKQLIQKLANQTSHFTQLKNRNMNFLESMRPINKTLFWIIENLETAIKKNRQVLFHYNQYDIDKKMHPKLDLDGKPRTYCVNPYQTVVVNNRYYLIGNLDKYDDVTHYRLDRITNIEMSEKPAKAMKKIDELQNGLDIQRYVSEHIYMFSGKSERVTFRAPRHLVSEIIDWFGMSVIFSDANDDEVTVSVMVNEKAMRYWVMQYSLHVTVLSPQNLLVKIKDDIRMIQEKYENIR